MAVYGLSPGDRVVEIGAGTGIATLPLVDCAFRVTAIEASLAMAALLEAKVGPRAEVIGGRFEDTPFEGSVDLVAAFNSWHWIDPVRGPEHVVEMLSPGGMVALIWTEVISWGEDPFGDRLADLSGGLWPTEMPEITRCKDSIEMDKRFQVLDQRSYRFDRTLDARGFVEVTKTYGGHLTEALLDQVEVLINDEFNGTVIKVEQATVFVYRRSGLDPFRANERIVSP